MELDSTLEKIKDIIINTVHPEKIILFGSRATGEFTDESDYDIFVLKSGIENERVISRAINRALYDGNILEPVDIIAMDSSKWEKNKNNKFMIYSDINTQGIILYE